MATKRDAAIPSAGWNPAWAAGEHGLPKERYIDPDFAKLEAEKLWPHVWQMACRIEEVPRPGDYTVYQIVDQEILIIRQADDSIKAYHNVCPHRATALAVGSGRFSTGEITCPFHGWRWNINGDCTFVLDRDEFKGGCLSDEDVALREVQVATWIGCVFINMDKDAPSFEDHIAPIKALVDPLLLDQMKFYWHKSVVAPCNWKIAQEAFHEEYHVPETHPQLWDKNLDYHLYTAISKYEGVENGHGYFHANALLAQSSQTEKQMSADERKRAEVESLIYPLEALEEGLDAMVLTEEVNLARSMRQREIPEGKSVGEAFREVLEEHYANQGRALPSAEALFAVTDMLIFPNYTFLPSFGNVLIYRSRPYGNDPDMCIFELWSCKTYPEGEAPPRPKTEHCTDPTDPAQYRLIPRQDFSNVPRIQRGLHSHGLQNTVLASRQERIIINAHKEIDKYLTA